MKPRQFAVLLALGGLGAMLLYWNLPSTQRARRNSICQSNLKMIGLAMNQYARDYDETFPLTNIWMDGLESYTHFKKQSVANTLVICPTSDTFYAYNSIRVQLGISNYQKLNTTPLVFEVAAGKGKRNLSDNGSLWPASPVHSWGTKSGNNVLFADGHVKLMNAKPIFKSFAPKPTPKPKASTTRKGKR